MSLFQHLVNFIKKFWRKKIPLVVDENEILVRGLVHPMFFSRSENTIKREAFLPPPDKSDVSLLRLAYTNDNFCKNHSMSLQMGNNHYCGMGTILCRNVSVLNEQEKETIAIVKSTPLSQQLELIENQTIFTTTPGLPMHADLIYNQPLKKGEVQTKFRKYANKLAKSANYFNDPKPTEPDWHGLPLN